MMIMETKKNFGLNISRTHDLLQPLFCFAFKTFVALKKIRSLKISFTNYLRLQNCF